MSRHSVARRSSPRASFTSKPASTVASDATGEGPGVQVRRRRDLEQVLHVGRARDEGKQRRVRLRETADEHHVLVGLAGVPDDAVAAHAVRARLVGRALPDHAEAVGVVDIEQRAVPARDRGERDQVRRVAGHAVHAIHADKASRVALGREQRVQVVGVLEAKAPYRRATCLCDLASVEIVLCARASRKMVPEAASSGITDMWMWVIVGRTSESSEPSSAVSRSSISS